MNKVLGGILLVSGTAIGAGMLALPVSTGLAGFYPSIILLLVCWLFMTFTAMLMLEVNLWMDGEANLITMARRTLGRWGELVSWVTYLFLLYALTTAYIAGSAPIFLDMISSLTTTPYPHIVGAIPLLGIFGFFVYKGTSSVDYVNRLLMIGLVVTYALMAFFLTPHVEPSLLTHVEWPPLLLATSVVVTSFGFHIIIPSLSTYMNKNVRQLTFTILIGSMIPVLVYLLWEFLTLGIIPLPTILSGYKTGSSGAELLTSTLHTPAIALIARCFAFFAIVTSFLGVSLSLSDFLADGLKIKRTRTGRITLYALTFVPPLLFTLTDPRAFLTALEYAGAFGVIVLLGLLPALMVWRGRYYLKLPSHFRAPGGKVALVVVIVISLAGIGLEVVNQLGSA